MLNKPKPSKVTQLELRRRELGYRQKEMAAMIRISPATYSDFEHGKVGKHFLILQRFADAFQWTIPELLRAIEESGNVK